MISFASPSNGPSLPSTLPGWDAYLPPPTSVARRRRIHQRPAAAAGAAAAVDLATAANRCDLSRPSPRTSTTANLDVSSHHVSAASCPSGPIAGGAGRRFSQLLLEHGELHLQDWAVLAASASVPSFGASSSAAAAPADNAPSSNGSRRGGKDKRSRSRRRRRSSKSSSKRNVVGRSSGGSSSNGGRIPSIGMRAIPGRLRLCTRSLVFEPDDATRGIIRCPFSKMAGRPRAPPQLLLLLLLVVPLLRRHQILAALATDHRRNSSSSSNRASSSQGQQQRRSFSNAVGTP